MFKRKQRKILKETSSVQASTPNQCSCSLAILIEHACSYGEDHTAQRVDIRSRARTPSSIKKTLTLLLHDKLRIIVNFVVYMLSATCMLLAATWRRVSQVDSTIFAVELWH